MNQKNNEKEQIDVNTEKKPKRKIKQLLLNEFLQQKKELEHIVNDDFTKLETPVDINHSTEIEYFLCPYCGSSKKEGHIKRGGRNHNHTEKAQRWSCKKHNNRRFTINRDLFNHPDWYSYYLDFYVAIGMETQDIIQSLKMHGRDRAEEVTISVGALRNLIVRNGKLLDKFEKNIEHPIVSKEWQMDEICQRLPNRKKLWIITVFADDTRYLLATYVCLRRSFNNSLKALMVARDRAKSDPHVVRCDGLKSHQKAAHYLFPNADIQSFTKKEKLGHISHAERGHKTIREGALYKRRRFRSPRAAQLYADIERFHYNFIRIHDTFGSTPAKASGLPYEFIDWRDLFYTAGSFYNKK